MTFKVWLCVEKHNPWPAEYEYEDVILPFGAEAEFPNEGQAVAYATRLHERFEPLIRAVAAYEDEYLSGRYEIDNEDVAEYEAREDDLLEIADLALTAFAQRVTVPSADATV